MTKRVERADDPIPLDVAWKEGTCPHCGAEMDPDDRCSARCFGSRADDTPAERPVREEREG